MGSPSISLPQVADLPGRVVVRGDERWGGARASWNRLVTRDPAVIAFCRSTEEVVGAVRWARREGMPFRVRSGRHELEGWSSLDDGLVIDVSEMKSVAIDHAARTATVGAGLLQQEAVSALGAYGLAAPTGVEGSVGLVGATLGGGFGLLTRAFGLASDNLLGVEIVRATADGSAAATRVDAEHDPDLLWALRGAGNGAFGVVTSLTYRVHPLPQAVLMTARWPGLDFLGEVFSAWQSTAPFTDARVTSQLEIHRDGIALIAVSAGGTTAEVHELLQPLLGLGSPEITVQEGPWADLYAGIQVPLEDEPANWRFGSQFVTEPFPDDAIAVVAQFIAEAPTTECNYFTNALRGGMSSSEPAGGSAFAHRGALFYAEPGAGWGDRAGVAAGDPALTEACLSWVDRFGRALEPYVAGAYVNVPNADARDSDHEYWGDGVERLRRIKAAYDPENVFHQPQSIRPAR
ncbi:FAD-binding protein [Cnuibacter physcomitrellae]|uniref:FAD-binding protein n=1 Tax=Cnuibacter physcomitrellae TaxID=1619308 RepID=A0A1X9LFI4_9MICO|nr:FAD-binding oxidoreductase [Cnuibacter physcomitrellae]ARJ03897.1 FAD-binding protein [Cnuibacter physcomitrellae]GGI39754.1 FAD-binding protein [Cnuibacter physcomitrellae]